VVEVVRREMEPAAQALGVMVPARIESEADAREEAEPTSPSLGPAPEGPAGEGEGAVWASPSLDGVAIVPEAAAEEPADTPTAAMIDQAEHGHEPRAEAADPDPPADPDFALNPGRDAAEPTWLGESPSVPELTSGPPPILPNRQTVVRQESQEAIAKRYAPMHKDARRNYRLRIKSPTCPDHADADDCRLAARLSALHARGARAYRMEWTDADQALAVRVGLQTGPS
jgi:hypothetical protein